MESHFVVTVVRSPFSPTPPYYVLTASVEENPLNTPIGVVYNYTINGFTWYQNNVEVGTGNTYDVNSSGPDTYHVTADITINSVLIDSDSITEDIEINDNIDGPITITGDVTHNITINGNALEVNVSGGIPTGNELRIYGQIVNGIDIAGAIDGLFVNGNGIDMCSGGAITLIYLNRSETGKIENHNEITMSGDNESNYLRWFEYHNARWGVTNIRGNLYLNAGKSYFNEDGGITNIYSFSDDVETVYLYEASFTNTLSLIHI